MAAGVLGLPLAGGCRLEAEGTPTTPAQLAPDFSLLDHRGQRVTLASTLARGPAVVIFYRGAW